MPISGGGAVPVVIFKFPIFPQTPVGLPGVGTLQEVEVPIIEQTSCRTMYSTDADGTDVVDILSDMICAGYQEGGKDSCQVRPRLPRTTT